MIPATECLVSHGGYPCARLLLLRPKMSQHFTRHRTDGIPSRACSSYLLHEHGQLELHIGVALSDQVRQRVLQTAAADGVNRVDEVLSLTRLPTGGNRTSSHIGVHSALSGCCVAELLVCHAAQWTLTLLHDTA
jgi:hypothetical protein